MNQLTQKTITSIEVAEMVGKDHNMLLRDIRRYVEQLGQSKIAQSDFFQESTYINSQNKELPCFNVTKKGCEFIGNKLTGVKGTEFTAKFIIKFNNMEETIKNQELSILDGLSTEMQALLMQDKKITAVVSRVDNLENTMNIDYAQQKKLRDFVGEVVKTSLGGTNSRAYKYKDENGKLASKVFSRIWHDFYDYFNINAYANLPRVRFDEALEYINKWQPPTNMQLEIGRINRMTDLEV